MRTIPLVSSFDALSLLATFLPFDSSFLGIAGHDRSLCLMDRSLMEEASPRGRTSKEQIREKKKMHARL